MRREPREQRWLHAGDVGLSDSPRRPRWDGGGAEADGAGKHPRSLQAGKQRGSTWTWEVIVGWRLHQK